MIVHADANTVMSAPKADILSRPDSEENFGNGGVDGSSSSFRSGMLSSDALGNNVLG
ncbi:hypothetical protein GGH93_004681 [Coemansia aciculifera]|nr:hypothetical protein GGH93_004681 [Coemansia aciculifera]